MAKISVILPVYNGAGYIKEAVESILWQTYKDFKLFVIDDGSSDNTISVLSELNDKRLNIIQNNTNKGLIYTLNKGLELAKESQYIARMDADDISSPNRFEKEIKILEENLDIGIVGCSVEYFGNGIKAKKIILPEFHDKIVPAFLCRNPIIHPAVMIRGSVLSNTNAKYDKEYLRYEDYKLWIDLFSQCKFYNIPHALLSYRRHGNNVSNVENYNIDADSILIKKIFSSYEKQLGLSFSKEDIEVLTLITSIYRWQANKLLPLHVIYNSINNILYEHTNTGVNCKYLSHLLWERVFVYLIKCNRQKDIVKLMAKLKSKVNYKNIVSIHNNWF